MASVVGLHMDAHFLSQVDADVWLLCFFSFSFLSHSLVWSSLLCSGPEWLLYVVLEHLSVAEKNTAPSILESSALLMSSAALMCSL